MATAKKSSKKTAKKVYKTAKKAAKKNPKRFAVGLIILIIIGALAVGGYILYKKMFPEYTFALNGNEVVSVGVNGEFSDPGVIAQYGGKDVSDKVTTTYAKGNDKISVDKITTEQEETFYITYAINYEKLCDSLTRTVKVTSVSPLDITFLEVGNKYTGDSTYIKAGDTDILIDAGSRQNSATTIANYVDQYCKDGKLEYVIATHAHQDHIAGFVGSKSDTGILNRYKIGTLIDFANTNATSQIYKDYESLKESKISAGDIEHHYTSKQCWYETDGAKKEYDLAPGIKMSILYQKFYDEKTSDENDYSVCLLISQGSSNYLFTGDLEKDGEQSLVTSNNLPEVELFKGGHHGSYTANTDALLQVVKPKNICICCCAGSDEYTKTPENMFPAQAAIDRMAKWTDKIYVTTVISDDAKGFMSMNGDIIFHSENGSAYTITGSNNSVILKDTDWFKDNRTWPTA